MTPRTRNIVATAMLATGIGFATITGMNAAATQQRMATYAATGDTASAPSGWDAAKLIGSALAALGFTGGSLVAFLRRSAESTVGRILPGGGSAAATAIDIAELVAIRSALAIVSDAATSEQLVLAGRSACDGLRDRVFPLPVEEAS